MKALYLLIPVLGLGLAACGNPDHKPKPPAPRTDADNTGKNIRDRNGNLPTAGDQSESEAARKITQKIRQALMKDNTLSTNARNIKIITNDNGIVVLRGAVNSENERNTVIRIVRNVDGVKSLDNHLEMAAD